MGVAIYSAGQGLTFKAPIITASDDILKFICFSDKIRLDILCKLSALQTCQGTWNVILFSMKNNKKS